MKGREIVARTVARVARAREAVAEGTRSVWIERLLWAQIVLALLSGVVLTVSGDWLGAGLLLGEGALIALALWAFRRRLALAPWLYLIVSLVIFVEAVTMPGLASIVFKTEAVLSLMACYYIFVMGPRRPADG